MEIEVFNFKEKTPKRGEIICFSGSEGEADFYIIDNGGYVWGKTRGYDEWEYCCHYDKLQEYGYYSHWARINKVFNVNFDIPKE